MDGRGCVSDDHGMETNTTSTEPTSPPGGREFVRPREGRMVAGVAAGLAHYLNLSRGLIRAGFVVTTFIGGLGVALYLAGWLLIRSDDQPSSPAQRLFEDVRSGRSWIGLALLALAAIIVLDTVTFLPGSLIWATVLVVVGYLLYRGEVPNPRPRPDAPPPAPTRAAPAPALTPGDQVPPPAAAPPPPPVPAEPPPPPPPPSQLGRITLGVALFALGVMAVADNLSHVISPQPRHYLALATVVIGLGLVTGGWMGRARWMILLGFFLIPALLVSPVAELDSRGDLDRFIRPTAVSELQSSYEYAVGVATFDLRDIPWDGEIVELEVDLAAGQVQIILPPDVAVTGTATVDVGVVDTPSAYRDGADEIIVDLDEPGTDGELVLDVQVGLGAVDIHIDERNS
jgi:phage shock protein PspC (stress-responsive transcriptional regulator)